MCSVFTSLSVCVLYHYLCMCFSLCLSVCVSLCLSVCVSVCLCVTLCVCLSVCVSLCLSVCLSVDSAPARSLLFFVVDSVCMYVCMSSLFVTLFQIDSSSLFLDGIQPFLGHHFSMAKATKRCSSNFGLLPWQRNLGYFCKNFKLLLFCFPMESSYFLVVNSP